MPSISKEKYIINICKSPQDDRDYYYENNDKFPIIFDMRKDLNKVDHEIFHPQFRGAHQQDCQEFIAQPLVLLQ